MMDNLLTNTNNNNSSGSMPTSNYHSLQQPNSANFLPSSHSININLSSLNHNTNSPLASHAHGANISRFSSLHSSPYLQDSSRMISFASLNVRGINNTTKFASIMDDLMDRNLSIIGLQETKCAERNASANFRASIAT